MTGTLACVTLDQAKHAFAAGLALGSAVTFTLAVVICLLCRRRRQQSR